MMKLHTFSRFFPFVVSAAFALAAPSFAHKLDPIEASPNAPAVGAEVETLTGEVKEVLVDDRVAGVQVRYRSLVLSDGTAVSLRGPSAERLTQGSRANVSGRRNGRLLFAESAEVIGPATVTHRTRTATVEGELQLLHIDYSDDGRGDFQFDVLGADGNVTPLRLATLPEALNRGMKVIASGAVDGDGGIDPDVISITALANEPAPDTIAAVKTNKVLVILMTFTDSISAGFTQADVQAAWSGAAGSGGVAEYYKEVSYSQQLLSVTVTPWLATGSPTPANCNYGAMATLGKNAATARGYNLTSYQNLVYVFPKISACGWAGLGYVGASGAWINGRNTVLVYGHELGHNLGMLHAASLDCGTVPINGTTCSASEYGEPFGIMGNKSTMHVSVPQKFDLGWITGTQVRTHTAGSATYTINPLETAGGAVYAVKIPAASNRIYWLEYRRPIGFDAGLASYPNNGAQLRLTAPFETLCAGCSNAIDTEFLDMTPATSAFTDGTLVAGASFTDTKYGITMNVISATASGLTVQVVGPGSTSTVTTTSISSSDPTATFGVSVTFTATVTGNAPTGTVAFKDAGVTLAGCAAVALSGSGNTRTAACTTSALAVGTHSVVAQYSGNASNSPSSSSALSQVVDALPASTNVALAAAGASAGASSYTSGFSPASVINGDRKGTNWGQGAAWMDATSNSWPDYIQVTFAGTKTIDEVVVYSVQNNYLNPVEPTATMTFTQYGVQDFTVQRWTGSAWVTIATVTGNNLVKRTVSFTPVATDRIRVNVTRSLGGKSRITEIEAWGN